MGYCDGEHLCPSYANLFLGWWEESQVFIEGYHPDMDKICLWARYIENIFVIWQGTQGSQFVNHPNVIHIGLKFRAEAHFTSLPFLEILISKMSMGALSTTIYRKRTSTNSLLLWEWPPLAAETRLSQITQEGNISDYTGIWRRKKFLHQYDLLRKRPKKDSNLQSKCRKYI